MNRPLFFDLLGIFPEIILTGCILLFIIFAAFSKDTLRSTVLVEKISIFLCILLFGAFFLQDDTPLYVFNGLFVRDTLSLFLKICITLVSVCVLSFSIPTLPLEKLAKPEYYIFFLTALLGMLFMISANHFMALYLALELQSISLYVLAGFKRDSRKTSEAAIKFFILGGLASAFFLFGLSFLYGVAGSLNYQDIAFVLKDLHRETIFSFQDPMIWSVFLGITFVLIAFFFKIAAAPFHMWTPDVYEGIPLPVMTFLSLVPKITGIAVLLKLLAIPFIEILQSHTKGIMALYPFFFQNIALLSIIWGSVAALFQQNIRRLLAYSSISHIGFILLAISAGNYSGIRAAVLYTFVYILMNIGLFGILCALRYPAGDIRMGLIEKIQDLQGLSRSHPRIALTLALIFLSMAGIPPLAGFFAKFYVLLSILEKGFIILAIGAILASVIGTFYYLRLIKYMYFEEPEIALEISLPLSSAIPVFLSLLSITLYSLYPTPFIWSASFITGTLLKG